MQPQPLDDLFTRATANAAGMSDYALGREVRAAGLERVRRGVYAAVPIAQDHRRAAIAASLAYTGLPLSHLSAAFEAGIPVVGARPTRPEMTVAPRGGGNVRGVHAYRARLREHELCIADGRLRTTPARTVIDIARHYPTITAVPAIDHVLHEKLATPEELRDVLDFCRGWPGAPRARRAVLLCDSRAESPLESVSRLVLPRLGLPTPEPQVSIYDASGTFIGRADFLWDLLGVVGEADGRAKYGDREVLIEEKRRETGLRDTGIEVARWYWRQAWSDRAALRNEVTATFRRAAERDRAGASRRWTAVSAPRLTVL